jgi:hypothetical protein
MSYIIVWRSTYREPFVDVDSRGFIEDYPTEEDAKKAAKEIEENENGGEEKSPWYFNPKIYKEV